MLYAVIFDNGKGSQMLEIKIHRTVNSSPYFTTFLDMSSNIIDKEFIMFHVFSYVTKVENKTQLFVFSHR